MNWSVLPLVIAAGRTHRAHPPAPAFILVFVVLSVVGTAALLVAAVHRQRRARAQLADLADRLHLELKRRPSRLGFEPPPTLEGTHRHRPVRFFTYATGSGNNRRTWSAVATAVPRAGTFTLSLYPENFLVRVATSMGLQDLRVGDPIFDQTFLVRSNDPDYAIAALLPEIRARLLEARQRGAHGHLKVEQGEVRYSEAGGFDDARRVERLALMLDPICDLAEVVEVYRS